MATIMTTIEQQISEALQCPVTACVGGYRLKNGNYYSFLLTEDVDRFLQHRAESGGVYHFMQRLGWVPGGRDIIILKTYQGGRYYTASGTVDAPPLVACS